MTEHFTEHLQKVLRVLSLCCFASPYSPLQSLLLLQFKFLFCWLWLQLYMMPTRVNSSKCTSQWY